MEREQWNFQAFWKKYWTKNTLERGNRFAKVTGFLKNRIMYYPKRNKCFIGANKDEQCVTLSPVELDGVWIIEL